MQVCRAKAFVILDGTLVPIGRISGSKDRRYYSGKHKRHGDNVQIIAGPHRELVGASPALPGSVHDLKAARTHRLIDALTRSALATLADKGYRGARSAVGVPFYGRHLPSRMREVNSAHAKVRAIGERAVSALKSWRAAHQAALLPATRYCPGRRDPGPPTGCSSLANAIYARCWTGTSATTTSTDRTRPWRNDRQTRRLQPLTGLPVPFDVAPSSLA